MEKETEAPKTATENSAERPEQAGRLDAANTRSFESSQDNQDLLRMRDNHSQSNSGILDGLKKLDGSGGLQIVDGNQVVAGKEAGKSNNSADNPSKDSSQNNSVDINAADLKNADQIKDSAENPSKGSNKGNSVDINSAPATGPDKKDHLDLEDSAHNSSGKHESHDRGKDNTGMENLSPESTKPDLPVDAKPMNPILEKLPGISRPSLPADAKPEGRILEKPNLPVDAKPEHRGIDPSLPIDAELDAKPEHPVVNKPDHSGEVPVPPRHRVLKTNRR